MAEFERRGHFLALFMSAKISSVDNIIKAWNLEPDFFPRYTSISRSGPNCRNLLKFLVPPYISITLLNKCEGRLFEDFGRIQRQTPQRPNIKRHIYDIPRGIRLLNISSSNAEGRRPIFDVFQSDDLPIGIGRSK